MSYSLFSARIVRKGIQDMCPSKVMAPLWLGKLVQFTETPRVTTLPAAMPENVHLGIDR